MYGGGKFTTQNKKLPGAYMNFVSASKATSTIGERGVAALAVECDWGVDNEIFTVTAEEFMKNSSKIFGYEYSNEKLKGIRDLFKNITKCHFYRLNSGVAAANTYATAKYTGVRGNDIKIAIQKNIDDENKFDVITLLENKEVDKQTVANMSELQNNDYVTFKESATLAVTAGTPLTDGANAESVTGEAHQSFLDKVESYTFNALGCLSKEKTVIALYVAYTKRMRDEMGIKFQAVVYNNAADHEGIINLKNRTVESETGLVYWVTGIIAGCAINKSNTNKIYDGEYEVEANYTQSDLEAAIDNGEFTLHKVGDQYRVLVDINSLVTVEADKGQEFKNNQTIRVIDQAALDIASVFNTKYIGNVPNNASGRVSLWNDIVSLYKDYETINAIEDFNSEEIVVEQGNDKKTVVVNGKIKPINAMEKLYMTIVVQ